MNHTSEPLSALDPAPEQRAAFTERLHQWGRETRFRLCFLRYRVADVSHTSSSDWDLVVPEPVPAAAELQTRIGAPLVTVPRHFVTQHFHREGQIDFLPRLEWHGWEYLEAGRFWSQVRSGADGLPRPALAHDAWIAWMTGLLWGARFNPKYRNLILQAWGEAPSEMEACARWAFGCETAGPLLATLARGEPGEAVALVSKLRRSLGLQSLRRSPLKALAGWWNHWRGEARLHRSPPYPWIAFLGSDPALVAIIHRKLAEYLEARRFHLISTGWRPFLFGKTDSTSAGRPPLHPAALAFDWWVGWLKYLHARAIHSMVLSEGGYPDLLADPERHGYSASSPRLEMILRFFPPLDRVIILDTDPAKVTERNPSVSPEEARARTKAYRRLADRESHFLLDAEQPVEVVVDQIIKRIFSPSPTTP